MEATGVESTHKKKGREREKKKKRESQSLLVCKTAFLFCFLGFVKGHMGAIEKRQKKSLRLVKKDNPFFLEGSKKCRGKKMAAGTLPVCHGQRGKRYICVKAPVSPVYLGVCW